MNVYDKAHETARALKESQQYLEFLAARGRLKLSGSWPAFRDLQSKQAEIHQMLIAGQEPPTEKTEELKRLFEILSGAPSVREYLQAEAQLMQVIDDVDRILLGALDLGMEE